MELAFQAQGRGGRRAAPSPRQVLALLTLFLILAAARPPALAQETSPTWATVVAVVDGDSLKVRLGGRVERVRLLGVDAPETGTSRKLGRAAARAGRTPAEEASQGQAARRFVAGLVQPGDRVRLGWGPEPRDPHRRLLAWVWLEDGRQLNRLLIAEGQARVYRRCPCPELPELLGLENQARQAGRGLWSRGGP
jgi:micrococcal nuclease